MERYILEALQKGLTAAVAASTKTDLVVKYVGRSQNPPNNDMWLEPVYIPNNITNEFWGSEKTHQGIMRLVMHCQQKDKGVYAEMDALQSVLNYFTKGKKLQDPGENVTVTITEVSDITGVLEDAPEILIPATIRYSFFSS